MSIDRWRLPESARPLKGAADTGDCSNNQTELIPQATANTDSGPTPSFLPLAGRARSKEASRLRPANLLHED